MGRRGRSGEGSVEIESIEEPQGLHERDQLLEALSGGLDNLPEELKVALVLREFDGLTYEEMLRSWSARGNGESRIFRAREALEKIIDRGIKARLKAY